jgi:hypothetical protein
MEFADTADLEVCATCVAEREAAAQVSNLPTCAAWEAAQGIARAQREQGPQGRASGRERANRRVPVGSASVELATAESRPTCGLEIRDTVDLEVCATSVAERAATSLGHKHFSVQQETP